MSKFEKDYKQLISDILLDGTFEKNRTKIDCLTCFNKHIEFDLSTGLMPVITGKKIFYDKAYHEFQWMANGETDLAYLHKHNIHWWDQYADQFGYLGKTYGYQLRYFGGDFDQLDYVIQEINKGSRRAHITMWNPTELEYNVLPCCYTSFTFVITEYGSSLNMNMSFRSSDVFLGLPYDFIVGALLLKTVAKHTNKNLGKISYTLNNAHIYENHINAAVRYLNAKIYPLPLDNETDTLEYTSGPYIKAKLNN